MNKKDLISKTYEVLRSNDIRKPISIKSERFRITDERGDEAVFTVERKDKRVLYNVTDITTILDAMIAIVEDCMRRGEPVSIRGFGSLEVRKSMERHVREPDQEIWHTIPERYRPKFTAGSNLTSAARSYGLQKDDIGAERFLPPPDDDEDEEEEDSDFSISIVLPDEEGEDGESGD